MKCDLCDNPISESDMKFGSIRQLVQGWEAKRSAGGTNQIKLRKNMHKFAHGACVDLAARGVAHGQTNLFK